MATLDDGGPAFPRPMARIDYDVIGDTDRGAEGMSLRDWFAGQALAGFEMNSLVGSHELMADNAAVRAYEIADKMLEERKLTD